jgi:hypothetical protein
MNIEEVAFAADVRRQLQADGYTVRGRMVSGKVVPTPWEGRWSNVQRHGGVRVPMTCEVSWLTREGRKPYWRGTIASLDYEFAK